MSGDALSAILDTLLPGDADWPAAGGLGLAGEVRGDLEGTEEGRATLHEIIAALPVDFARGDAAAREATLRRIEAAMPQAFERLVAAAYLAYYVDVRVRAVVERVTGYENRPPQPLGYELEPFDETLLERQKQRAPFWRRA
jgi:hypothetical protein